jgi:predicted PurR-regulated permease PerM
MAQTSQQADAPVPAEISSVRGWLVSVTPRTIWTTLAIVGGAVLTFLVLSKAIDAILLLFVAIVLAEGIRPLVDALENVRLPRPLAVLLIYLAGLGIAGGLVWLLLQPVLSEAAAFANALPGYAAELQQLTSQVQQTIANTPSLSHALDTIESQAANQLGSIVTALVSLPFTFLGIFLSVILILTLAFFWLTATAKLLPFVVGLLPVDQEAYARATVHELSVRLGGYTRGIVVNMGVIGLLTGLGLFALGVPYALLLGLAAGLIELIPFLGPWISGSIALTVALLASGPLKGVEVIAVFVAIQQLEANTLVPLVMSRTARLNPLTVLVALVIGEALLGIVGAILAVPAAVVVQVLVVRVIAPLARTASARPNPRSDL